MTATIALDELLGMIDTAIANEPDPVDRVKLEDARRGALVLFRWLPYLESLSPDERAPSADAKMAAGQVGNGSTAKSGAAPDAAAINICHGPARWMCVAVGYHLHGDDDSPQLQASPGGTSAGDDQRAQAKGTTPFQRGESGASQAGLQVPVVATPDVGALPINICLTRDGRFALRYYMHQLQCLMCSEPRMVMVEATRYPFERAGAYCLDHGIAAIERMEATS